MITKKLEWELWFKCDMLGSYHVIWRDKKYKVFKEEVFTKDDIEVEYIRDGKSFFKEEDLLREIQSTIP